MVAIAVTGATGALGGRVARLLAGDGADLVLVVRDPARAPEPPGAQVRRAEHGDGERQPAVGDLTGHPATSLADLLAR